MKSFNTVYSGKALEQLEPRQLMAATAPSAQLAAELNIFLDANGNLVQTSGPGVTNAVAAGDFIWAYRTESTAGISLSDLGLQNIMISTTGAFRRLPDGSYEMSVPHEASTRQMARDAKAAGKILVINIEHWPLDVRYYGEAAVEESIAKFKQIFDWVRDEEPEVKFGVYMLFPIRDYHSPVRYERYNRLQQNERKNFFHFSQASNQLAAWHAANDRMAELAAMVDYIFPSLYTFYEDQTGWVDYARHNIAEAARYGKPVIPFLWPLYHGSAPANLARTPIPQDFWELQLQTVRDLASGAVIWTEYDDTNFDLNTPWVQSVVAFAAADAANSPALTPDVPAKDTDPTKHDDTTLVLGYSITSEDPAAGSQTTPQTTPTPGYTVAPPTQTMTLVLQPTPFIGPSATPPSTASTLLGLELDRLAGIDLDQDDGRLAA